MTSNTNDASVQSTSRSSWGMTKILRRSMSKIECSAEPQLPAEVQQIGVTILKQNNNILFAGALYTDNNDTIPSSLKQLRCP